MTRLLTVTATALMALSACAALAEPAMVGDTASGKVLTDAAGMTLYTFDKDTAEASNCNGPCAVNWPPLMADAYAKPADGYTVITRADGSHQWAYDGKPLYLWIKDKAPGDVTGDGFNGVWHLARP